MTFEILPLLPPRYEDISTKPHRDAPPKSTPVMMDDHSSCDLCQHLDLSYGSFNIHGRQAAVQKFARDGRDDRILEFSPEYANSRYLLGTYEEIHRRAGTCPFCRLVWRSINSSSFDRSNEKWKDSKCFLTWELDGRNIDPNTEHGNTMTRKIRIHWDGVSIPDAFAIFLAPPKSFSTDLATTNPNAAWTDHFQARKIHQEASKIGLIQGWLNQCLHGHEDDCRQKFELRDKSFSKIAKESHFGVIDVVEMRLSSLPLRSKKKSGRSRWTEDTLYESDTSSDEFEDATTVGPESDASQYEPYVALSYVWGSKEDQEAFEDLRTSLKNVLIRGTPNALEEDMKKMPKSIQSSVELVRRLGYRYLWIDSICIVQDSKRSWKWNSEVMDCIYSNAEFTICAADGSNAKTGLVALDPPEETQEQNEQIIERCAPRVRLTIARDVESQVASSTWNKRAWTFQKRLLSPRCLIFTQGRIFFQCRAATFSEDIVTPHKTTRASAWSLDLINSPLVLLKKLQDRPFWFFMNSVELYSGRSLTKSKDILAAFKGVLNLIDNAMSGPSAFGLPTSHFDLALLWTPKKALKRRKGDDRDDFPSWSWCGWEGGSVSYVSQDFIQDCLENVHHWLISHTWIQWHIRDHESKLRPLWWTCESEPAKGEERWKGYDSFDYSSEQLDINHKMPGDEEDVIMREKLQLDDERRRLEPQRHMTHSPNQGVQDLQNGQNWQGQAWSDASGWQNAPDHQLQTSPNAPVWNNRQQLQVNHGAEDDLWSFYDVQTERPRPGERIMNEINPQDAHDHERLGPGEAKDPRMNVVVVNKVYNGYGREGLKRRQARGSTVWDPDHRSFSGNRGGAYGGQSNSDPYGRNFSAKEAWRYEERKFKKRAPESPFAVHKAQFSSQYPFNGDSTILQFWTESVWLYLVEPPRNFHPKASGSTCGPGLRRYGIADGAGDWCGSIVLSEEWAQDNIRKTQISGGAARFQFVALSDAKKFTEEECETWSYYVPLDRQQSEWNLHYVMLVEKEDGVHYRIGVGKVFKSAFQRGARGPARWEEIVLG
ncbi:heterokaryon incompatibility protein-domain-containing protein [Phyllosticta capitalensis]|uniref:Heterokaryon incompatibility protein-domain-containing protein n=1 Tax=Phyllosticta capitalensis TaxID=121624 RepID=A0ABR1Y9A2_9PEZI